MLGDVRCVVSTECCVVLGFCWLFGVCFSLPDACGLHAVVLPWAVWGVVLLCGVAIVFGCVLHVAVRSLNRYAV